MKVDNDNRLMSGKPDLGSISSEFCKETKWKKMENLN